MKSIQQVTLHQRKVINIVYYVRLFCFVFLLSNLPGFCMAQVSPLWDDLPKAKYTVGFKRIYARDYSRAWHLVSIESGKQQSGKVPRPIVVNIWYPASVKKGNQMKYKEYHNIQIGEYPIKDYQKLLVEYNKQNLARYFLDDQKILDDSNYKIPVAAQAELDRLLNTPTGAFLNAPAAPQQFPMLLWHQGLGGTVDDNSVFCEWFASQGYIVVGACFQAERFPDMFVNWDLDRSINDINFILNLLHKEKNIDFNRIALMGHSYGAQAVAAYAAKQNSPADLIICVDPTFDYDKNLKVTPFANLYTKLLAGKKNINTPVLAIGCKNRNPLFLLWDSMVYAERYYMSVPSVDHNDFVSQGALRRFFGMSHDADPKKDKALWVNYKNTCTEIRDFVDHYFVQKSELPYTLKNVNHTTDFTFEHIPRGQSYNRAPSNYDTTANYAPISGYQIDGIVNKYGIQALIRLGLRYPDAVVFNEDNLNQLGYAYLYEVKKVKEAVEIFKWSARQFPTSWNVWDSYAEAVLAQGNKERAIKYYKKSVELNPQNKNGVDQLKKLLKD